MRILNLTQHAATADQLAVGVFEPSSSDKKLIAHLLTFTVLPTRAQISSRCRELCLIIWVYDKTDAVMIGGASYLISRLDVMIPKVCGMPALHSFTARDSVEVRQEDGSVKKTQVFRHLGFVDLGGYREDIVEGSDPKSIVTWPVPGKRGDLISPGFVRNGFDPGVGDPHWWVYIDAGHIQRVSDEQILDCEETFGG